MSDEILIINDEIYFGILNGTNYKYKPIPKEFKPHFAKLLRNNQKLRINLKEQEEELKVLKCSLQDMTSEVVELVEKKVELPKKILKERNLYKHRLMVANEYIVSRKDNMIPEHYDDLRYIINECDLESSW